MKKFNNAGPSVPGEHFMIDPLARIDLASIETLMADKRYFILHAPRQTGRQTSRHPVRRARCARSPHPSRTSCTTPSRGT